VEVSGVAEAWFAVRTRARAEKAVRDYLGTRVPQVFLPTVTRWSRWKDRKKAVEWPLFAGYCFAHFDPADHFAVVTCPGVAGIISHAGKLAEVPDHEVESLRTLVSSELQYDPAPFIKEGDPVLVVYGPLRGVIGRLVKKGEHARLVLSVDLLSRAVSVTVDAADVKAL
jgi:transcription antitermination factor NusG